MSGSVGLSTAPFTDAERVDLRRFCGYPAYGFGQAGFQGWRFFQQYGLLEYRLTNLGPSEFQVARQYLAQLYPLENAITAASATLEVDKAAAFTRNAKELKERNALFDGWRRRLCDFIGVPPGPALAGGATMGMVV